MPLIYTGETLDMLNTISFRAQGSDGEIVVVEASHQVVQDYGEYAVHEKGSHKYDAGDVHNNKVTVRTADFAAP